MQRNVIHFGQFYTSMKHTEMSVLCSVEDTTSHALKVLLFFTLLMVTLPLTLYFATKSFVFEGKMCTIYKWSVNWEMFYLYHTSYWTNNDYMQR